MKTPQEWAEYLPEPIRTQFLENVIDEYVSKIPIVTNIENAIAIWLFWDETPQGNVYWDNIHDRALNGEFSQPIPTTPTEVKEEVKPIPTKAGNVTAVEWLVEQIENKNGKEFASYFTEFINQAKAIFEEQIESAYFQGGDDMKNDKYKGMVTYFDKTYGGEK
jgi:hypothetical protein